MNPRGNERLTAAVGLLVLVPDDRDFFAVYRRLPGMVDVPLR